MKFCSLFALLCSLAVACRVGEQVIALSAVAWNDGDDPLSITVDAPSKFAFGVVSSSPVGDRYLLPFTFATVKCTNGTLGNKKFSSGYVALPKEILVDVSFNCRQFVVEVVPSAGAVGIVELNATFFSSAMTDECSYSSSIVLNLASSGRKRLDGAVSTGTYLKREDSVGKLPGFLSASLQSGCACAIGCGTLAVEGCTGVCGTDCRDDDEQPSTVVGGTAGVRVRAFIHVPYHREDDLNKASVCGPRVEFLFKSQLLWASDEEVFDADGVVRGEVEFVTAQHSKFYYEARIVVAPECKVTVWDAIVTLIPVSDTIEMNSDELVFLK